MQPISDPVAFLHDLGFEEVGNWSLVDGLPCCTIVRHGAESGILYAFISQSTVLYVGKSVRTLARRMYGYQNPGETQRTNRANNDNIKKHLAKSTVGVLALVATDEMFYRGVRINIAAGLEDELIKRLRPLWNRMGVSRSIPGTI
jgi:hypothetical protein